MKVISFLSILMMSSCTFFGDRGSMHGDFTLDRSIRLPRDSFLLTSPSVRIGGPAATYEYLAKDLPVSINPTTYSIGVSISSRDENQDTPVKKVFSVEVVDISGEDRIAIIDHGKDLYTGKKTIARNVSLKNFKVVVRVYPQDQIHGMIDLYYLLRRDGDY